jgi:hypothetical protein
VVDEALDSRQLDRTTHKSRQHDVEVRCREGTETKQAAALTVRRRRAAIVLGRRSLVRVNMRRAVGVHMRFSDRHVHVAGLLSVVLVGETMRGAGPVSESKGRRGRQHAEQINRGHQLRGASPERSAEPDRH